MMRKWAPPTRYTLWSNTAIMIKDLIDLEMLIEQIIEFELRGPLVVQGHIKLLIFMTKQKSSRQILE